MRTRNHSSEQADSQVITHKLHPRNRHQGRYDFARLILSDASLGPFVVVNAQGEHSIDFADPAAVKALNRALLKDSYGIQGWDIPPQNLCPAIPGRADYVHNLADLLAGSNGDVIPNTKMMQVLDIGTGANCIYPLIGYSEYGWRFIASDISAAALANASAILEANPLLQPHIALRLQHNAHAVFKGILLDDEWVDLTMCNPPFHATQADAQTATHRKWRNLGKQDVKANLNFGGEDAELWCDGGEQAFIQRMISESALISTRCFWFTTLVSKSASLLGIYAALKLAGVKNHKTIGMHQGQKNSRLVAWTFLNAKQQAAWRKLRWKA